MMATIRCEVCKREEDVSTSGCLRSGWPVCHGYTMTLITSNKPPIDWEAETRKAIGKVPRP